MQNLIIAKKSSQNLKNINQLALIGLMFFFNQVEVISEI